MRASQHPAGRALHVISSSARRGAEVFAVELSEALDSEFPGIVVALGPGPAASASLEVDVIGQGWCSFRTLAEMRRQIRQSSVVVAHGSVTLSAAALAGLGLRVPLVYKNIGEPWFWATSPRRRWQTIALMRRVDYVAALTPSAALAVADCWKVDPSKIVVTGGGRDARRFYPPSDAERREARAALGLGEASKVVLVLGALSAEKRPDLALNVAESLPEATFLFAGDGPLREVVDEMARAIGGRVHVLGAREDVVRLLHAANLLLLTSASEGLPGVLIEAGLSGLPTVATDVGYVSDVIDDGVTGVIAKDDAVAGLAAGIRCALAQERAMGKAARARCLRLFDVTVVRDRWLELLLRASGGSAPV